MESTEKIKGYHAHVYYDKDSLDQAERLCRQAGKFFSLSVGHMHQQPVGPHPMWSCQLSFKAELFGQVIPWLAVNRHGLTIFIHAVTGNDLQDHTDYALWMGSMETLDLSIFE